MTLQDITNIATIIGVIVAAVGILMILRQIRESTASRYVDILLRSTQDYSSEDMLKAVRLVRETPIEKYKEILENSNFTDPIWVARRKVSAYWQTMAIILRKGYVDKDTFFSLTKSTVSIYKKLREIRSLPNPEFTIEDFDDNLGWLYEEWKKWAEMKRKN